MPMARVATAMMVKSGFRKSLRVIRPNSRVKAVITILW
jgi:hypothetical protein